MWKSMSKLVMQPSLRAVGQRAAGMADIFKKPKNKRQMSGLGGLTAIHLSHICMTVRLGWSLPVIHLSLILGFYKCLPFHGFLANWALKLGCSANFDILFLVMGFISLVEQSCITDVFSSFRCSCPKSMATVLCCHPLTLKSLKTSLLLYLMKKPKNSSSSEIYSRYKLKGKSGVH